MTRIYFVAPALTDLPSIDLLDPDAIQDPYPLFERLREQAPVREVADSGVYLVATRELIEEALNRPEDFSANLTGVLMTGSSGAPEIFDLQSLGATVDSIANADEPFHSIHRKLVFPQLSPSAVATLEEPLRLWSAATLEPLLAAGAGDFVQGVAHRIPVRAVAQILGLPEHNLDELMHWALAGTELLAGTTKIERMMEVASLSAALSDYLSAQLERMRNLPDRQRPPAMLRELARGIDENRIEIADAIGILIVLVGAGAESTASLLGNATQMLASNLELQQELRESPEKLPAFIEEALRLESPFRGHYRAVTRKTTLGGLTLAPGSRLLLLWAAANRDPKLFPSPNTVDLSRAHQREHLAFGRGLHFCIGARLARLEARLVLEKLLATTREFRCDPQVPARYVPSIFVRRLSRLQLRIDAA